eukprot:10785001-Ditylum_brightwellii.AAC.1
MSGESMSIIVTLKHQAELAALGHSFKQYGSRHFFCDEANDEVDKDNMQMLEDNGLEQQQQCLNGSENPK